MNCINTTIDQNENILKEIKLTQDKLDKLTRFPVVTIKKFGRDLSKKYTRMRREIDAEEARERVFSDCYDLIKPSKKIKNVDSRLMNNLFVSRKLLQAVKYRSLYLAQKYKKVGNGAEYCDDNTMRLTEEQDKINEETLSRMIAVSPSGARKKVSEMGGRSRQRFAELYVFLKDMRKLEAERRSKCIFFTFTLPPEFHANPTRGKNSWNEDLDIKAAQEVLSENWKIFQDRCRRSKNNFRSFRVVEPHKDACPHWHGLIFYAEESESYIESNLREIFGIDERRCKLKGFEHVKFDYKEDNSVSNIAAPESYMTKYLLKGLGSDEIEIKTTNESGEQEKAESNEAFKRVINSKRAAKIRSFAFSGLSREMTAWRTLRSFANSFEGFEESGSMSEAQKNYFHELLAYATNNDAFNFMKRFDRQVIKNYKETYINEYNEEVIKNLGIQVGSYVNDEFVCQYSIKKLAWTIEVEEIVDDNVELHDMSKLEIVTQAKGKENESEREIEKNNNFCNSEFIKIVKYN